MTDDFDRPTALRALRLLDLAVERWHEQYERMCGEAIEDSEDVATLLHGYAVEALMWARGLDDWCRGGGGSPALPGYCQAREREKGLLEGARYVVNRSVHQLGIYSRAVGGFTFPFSFPLKFDKLAGVEWLPEAFLPPAETENDDRQRALRSQYVEHLARQGVATTMERLQRWFKSQLME